MEWVTRAADKVASIGTVVSAASCPACFPALASLGAAAGLGFLAGFESLFIRVLLPLFAGVALVAHAAAWWRHRQWQRLLLGMLGPALVLAALLLFFGQAWTSGLLYAGLALMVGVSLWDIIVRRPRAGRAAACALQFDAVLTCPHCGHAKREPMPTDACQFFYECANCGAVLRPKPGDCCVFCSYGSAKCPPVQAQQPCCA